MKCRMVIARFPASPVCCPCASTRQTECPPYNQTLTRLNRILLGVILPASLPSRPCLPPAPLTLCGIWLVLVGLLPGPDTARAAETPAPPFYALLVGGGPDVESNAAQIEGHTRFVAALLPAAARRVVLFGNGKTDQPSVTYADTSPAADARRALTVLLADPDATEPVLTRPPKLDFPLDGPARLPDVRRGLGKLIAQAAKQPAPLLLYFAGHGTQDEKKEQDTDYDLWAGDKLRVRTLADELARVPRPVPVVLVMAQCFSGAFANLLFAHGDPEGVPAEQNLVGFFSATKDREAAGCSYATGRADYQDFSSYFFGALCGHDRFGGAVTGADYDGDGSVSLHEAFCYALIHDQSGDTPVCTSDVFLQRMAPLSGETVYNTPYHEVWQAGTPAQRTVLDALSDQLGLDGEARALAAYDRLTYGDPASRPALLKRQTEAKEHLNAVRAQALGPFFVRWPEMRWGKDDTGRYRKAFEGALGELIKDDDLRRTLLDAEESHEQADEAVDNEEAALMRFAGTYEHIVAARHLREHGKAEVRAQFERLWKGEQRTLPLAAPR